MEINLTKDNFTAEVLESDIPVLVDFWAAWCGPCKMLAPLVAEVAEKYDGKIKVGKVNIDSELDLAQDYKIVSIPTLLIFKNGELTDRSIGFIDKARLEQLVERVL